MMSHAPDPDGHAGSINDSPTADPSAVGVIGRVRRRDGYGRTPPPFISTYHRAAQRVRQSRHSDTSHWRRTAGSEQVLQGDGDPSWQRQRLDLRNRVVDGIRNLAKRHLAVLPDRLRCVRSTVFWLPQAARIDHHSSAESLDERKMCVAHENDVGVNRRALLVPCW